jgi:hypothetical protein
LKSVINFRLLKSSFTSPDADTPPADTFALADGPF